MREIGPARLLAFTKASNLLLTTLPAIGDVSCTETGPFVWLGVCRGEPAIQPATTANTVSPTRFTIALMAVQTQVQSADQGQRAIQGR